jgi:hypothetical protein
MMEAINESTSIDTLGKRLQLKRQDDFIDENGDFRERKRRTNDFASKVNGCSNIVSRHQV